MGCWNSLIEPRDSLSLPIPVRSDTLAKPCSQNCRGLIGFTGADVSGYVSVPLNRGLWLPAPIARAMTEPEGSFIRHCQPRGGYGLHLTHLARKRHPFCSERRHHPQRAEITEAPHQAAPMLTHLARKRNVTQQHPHNTPTPSQRQRLLTKTPTASVPASGSDGP